MRDLPTRKERRAKRRAQTAHLRHRIHANRAAHKATKAVATGTPQPVRTQLVAAGLDDNTAKRFAPAFSRGITADGTRDTKIKLKGRTTKHVTVKLYTATTFTARLTVYRPRDKAAAARFNQLAMAVAA